KQSAYEGYIAAEYKPKNGSNQSFTWKKKYFSDDVNI
ncbi:hydroxypyruvate isomerase, partial [Acinetobacter baumannii]